MTNFSQDQLIIFNKYIQGDNIFITGPGGCGKTYLIKEIVKHGKKNQKKIHVCALTGCAAVLLECNARTLHSWSGIGLASDTIEKIVERVVRNVKKKQNWLYVEVLIIDEVSMLSLKLFKILDLIGRKVKKNDKPFGGIQLIFSGDFYQLPPIGNEEDFESTNFCFEAENWEQIFGIPCFLNTNFRQKDLVYNKILNQIRIGKIYSSSCKKLISCINKNTDKEMAPPVILLPKRNDVDLINKTEYNKISEKEYEFKISLFNNLCEKENCKPDEKEFELQYLQNNSSAENNLKLKIGTKVMCIANIDMESEKPIVNGSQGIIVDFENNLPKVKFNNGAVRIINKHLWLSEKINSVGISQIPLIYAWAITIHKSQGLTLENAFIDAGSNIFEAGQTYVALSRLVSLDGLFLKNFDPSKIKINRKVFNFYNKYEN